MPAEISTTTIAKISGQVTLDGLRQIVDSTKSLPGDTKVTIQRQTGDQRDPYDETTFTFTRRGL